MDIRLDCGEWYIYNGSEYIICGNKEDGYRVEDYKRNEIYKADDFESCLTWCWNS